MSTGVPWSVCLWVLAGLPFVLFPFGWHHFSGHCRKLHSYEHKLFSYIFFLLSLEGLEWAHDIQCVPNTFLSLRNGVVQVISGASWRFNGRSWDTVFITGSKVELCCKMVPVEPSEDRRSLHGFPIWSSMFHCYVLGWGFLHLNPWWNQNLCIYYIDGW